MAYMARTHFLSQSQFIQYPICCEAVWFLLLLLFHGILYSVRTIYSFATACKILLPLQTRTCICEEGYTEVMSSNGTLEQCTLIPVVAIPTVEDKKGDVKTSRAVNPTQPSNTQAGRGRTWFLQPFGPGEVSQEVVSASKDHHRTRWTFW